MTDTTTKPKIGESGGEISLPNEGLTFSTQWVVPTNFFGLRQFDYHPGFRMSTMPELIPLVLSFLESPDPIVIERMLDRYYITGNTGVLYTPEGMFVQDNPHLLPSERIHMDAEKLKSKLSSHERNSVVFSDDGSVRFTPRNFKRGSQTPLELSTNSGIIALVGDEGNAEKLARVSEHYNSDPCFFASDSAEPSEIRVPSLLARPFGNGPNSGLKERLTFGDNYAHFRGKYSFGVKTVKET